MVASSSTTKVPLAASVEDMWPALKNAVTLIAQHCPQFIQSCELLHGDGGLGSIRLVKFGPASGLVTFAKEEIVEVDEEKMVLTYLLLEGDLKKQFKLFKPSISLEKVATSGQSLDEKKVLEGQCESVNDKEVLEGQCESVNIKEVLEGQCESVANWTLEYEVEEGMPPPPIELLNEGAKMFFKLLEASVKALKAQADINSTSHLPVKEEVHTIKEEAQTPLIV